VQAQQPPPLVDGQSVETGMRELAFDMIPFSD
jgi:hypothetical protein